MSLSSDIRASGFWGLILEPGKLYSKQVDVPFHLTAAVLDTISTEDNEDEVVAVMLEVDGMEIIICNLSKTGTYQCPLNLKFEEGSRISFFSTGSSASVHLSGNILGNRENYSAGAMKTVGKFTQKRKRNKDDDDGSLKKIKKGEVTKAIAKMAVKKLIHKKDDDDDDEDDDGEEDSEEDIDEEEESSSEEDDDDEEEESEEESEEEEEEEETKVSNTNALQALKVKKLPPGENKIKTTPKSESGKESLMNKSSSSNDASPQKRIEAVNGKSPKQKKSENSNVQVSSQTPNKSPKVVKKGGITCEDLTIGKGEEAKLGKNVKVYYEGRLASSKKVFDKCLSGKPFRFRLGTQDIIQAWNIGVAGMKVGGKRRITCPPHLAYGKRGAPPDIPPQATLLFEIELKSLG